MKQTTFSPSHPAIVSPRRTDPFALSLAARSGIFLGSSPIPFGPDAPAQPAPAGSAASRPADWARLGLLGAWATLGQPDGSIASRYNLPLQPASR